MDAAGLLSADYAAAMTAAAETWSQYVGNCRRLRDVQGQSDVDLKDMRRVQAMVNESQAALSRWLGVLGMTPADRSRITSAVRKPEPAKSGPDKSRFFKPRIAAGPYAPSA